MTTITSEQEQSIRNYFVNRHIPSGLGSEDEPCSIAGINLALGNRLSDIVPTCMSLIIGKWIIGVQDAMPDDIRNSQGWRELLPLAAGTGRKLEKERLAIIMAWMWEAVLPSVQPIADNGGFGLAWMQMCTERSKTAAEAAGAAVRAATRLDQPISDAAVRAAEAAGAAVRAAVTAASWATTGAAGTAEAAGWAAGWVNGRVAGWATTWAGFAPCALLQRLIVLEKGSEGLS